MRISTVQPYFIMASLTEDEKFLWQSKGNFAHSMSIHIVHATLLDVRCGGLRVNVLDSGASGPVSSPTRDIVLCSWARHFTLTVPLSTKGYMFKCVPANLMLGSNPVMD